MAVREHTGTRGVEGIDYRVTPTGKIMKLPRDGKVFDWMNRAIGAGLEMSFKP